MSESRGGRRFSEAEKPSSEVEEADVERRGSGATIATNSTTGWGIKSRKIHKDVTKKGNADEFISSDDDHKVNSDATSGQEESFKQVSSGLKKGKAREKPVRLKAVIGKILSASQSHDSEDLESSEFVNLKDLPKLPRIESDLKGHFLGSTHKFERPITGFQIRVRLLKYPSFAERSKWPGELLVLEDRVFSWQEKVFSKPEVARYSEKKCLKSDLDHHQYHKEIEDNPNSIGNYLHTYIDSDYYVISQEEKTLIRKCPALHFKRSKKISGISSELKSLNSDGESVLDEESEVEDQSTKTSQPVLSGSTITGKIQKKLSEDEEHKVAEKQKKNEERRKKENDEKEAKKRAKEEKNLEEALKKSKKQQQTEEKQAKIEQQLKKELEKRDDAIKKHLGSSRPSEAISARISTSSSSAKKMPSSGKKISKNGKKNSDDDWEDEVSHSSDSSSKYEETPKEKVQKKKNFVGADNGNYEKLIKKDQKVVKSRTTSPQQKITKIKATKAIWRVAHRRLLERSTIQPPQAMYIMATIPHMTRRKREIAVCVIKAYPKLGVVVLKPPFGYRIIEAKRNHIYRLSWELYLPNASMDNAKAVQADLKLLRTFTDPSENFRRLPSETRLIDDMIATFEIAPMNEMKLVVMGEIVCAEGFDTEPLCVHYLVEMPRGWRNDSVASNLQGITHNCFTTDDLLAYFSHPFYIQLAFSMDLADREDSYFRPMILLMVVSLSSSGRVKYEGYAYITIPSTPGSHLIRIQTWKPKPRSIVEKMQHLFLDVSPSLQDIHAAHIPVVENEKCRRANRLGLQTEPSGFVKFRLNVIHQTPNSYRDPASKLDLLEKMSSATILKSVQAVIEAFHRAKKRAIHVKDNSNHLNQKDSSHIL